MFNSLITMQAKAARATAVAGNKHGLGARDIAPFVAFSIVAMSLLAPALASAACVGANDGSDGLRGILGSFTNTIRSLAGPAGLLVITAGGLLIAFAFKQDFVSKGQKFIKNAVIGIGAIALAAPILGWIVAAAGVAGDTASDSTTACLKEFDAAGTAKGA